MAELDRAKLKAWLATKAQAKTLVTLKEVATQFGVTDGAAGKCLSLLTGNRVLIEKASNEFDCSRVLGLSLQEFESAASQGKTNTAYVDGLWRRNDQLKADNDTMRAKLKAALAQIEELESSK